MAVLPFVSNFYQGEGESSHKLGWLAIAFLAIGIAIRKIYLHVRSPLYKFPGPRFSAWSNAPYSYTFLTGQQPFEMLKMHEKYGSVVRSAPNEISFNTASAWKDIYGFRPGHKTFIKSEFYDGSSFIDQGAHGLATCRDPDEHARQRRYLSHAFSERALREQEVLVAEIVDLFVDKVGEVGQQKEGLDLGHWLRMCMFDITGSLAFGRTFDAVKNNGQHPSVKFIHKALRQIAILDTMRRFPWLSRFLMLFMSAKIQKLLDDNRIHEEYTMAAIVERLNDDNKRPDFLSRLTEKGTEEEVSAIQLAAHAADMLQAGSDTSNTTLNTVFYYLMRRPDLMEALQKEIRPRFQSYSEITARSTNNIPLIRAFVLEALRMYPSLPLGLPRVVPEGGDTVDGHFIPAGTIVSVNPYAACLSPSNFHDPWTFKPERWLDKDHSDNLDASQPWSCGPRGCIGQNLAWIEMNTILAKLIYMYDFEWVNTGMDLHRDSKMDTMWESPPLVIRVKKWENARR